MVAERVQVPELAAKLEEIGLDLEDLDTPATLEQLAGLMPLLSSDSTDVQMAVAAALGDLARNDANRANLGQKEEAVEKLVQFFKSGNARLQQWAARAIGNLAYEHEENRGAVMKYLRAEDIMEVLSTATEADLLKNLAGAVANLTNVSDELQSKLVELGAVPFIVRQLHHPDENVVVLSARALCNLADSEEHRVAIANAGGVEALQKLAFESEADVIRNECISALNIFTEASKQGAIKFIEDGGAAKVLNMAKSDSNEKNQLEAFTFLGAMAEQEEVRKELLKSDVVATLLKDLSAVKAREGTDQELAESRAQQKKERDAIAEASGAEKESEEEAAKKKDTSELATFVTPGADLVYLRGIMRLLGHLCVDDSFSETLFPFHRSILMLMRHVDLEVRLHSSMTLGNIIRSEEKCHQLLQEGVLERLVEIAQEEDSRLQHFAASAIRNLSIPESLRQRIGTAPNVIESLVSLMDSQSAHTLFSCILAIKVLTKGREDVTKIFFTVKGFEKLIEVFERNLVANQQRIHFEGARILVTLAETKAEYRHLVVTSGGLKGIRFLLESSFALLHNEGLRVLFEASKTAELCSKIAEDEELAVQIAGKLSSEDTTVAQLALGTINNLANAGEGSALQACGAREELLKVQAASAGKPAATVIEHLLAKLPAPEAKVTDVTEEPAPGN